MNDILKTTTIGGAEVAHTSSFTDEELRLAFCYLYRLQALRSDRPDTKDGQTDFTIRPSDEDAFKWIFQSLNKSLPVCITPEFELAQTISMAKTAQIVTRTLQNLRMAEEAI